MSTPKQGTLFVVATPIGHRDDITVRAIETLKRADVVAAEDTRHTRPLLQHYAIDTPLVALHDHNERTAVDGLVTRMLGGESVALVSDAGTPLISDPGFRLVRAARAAGIRVSPIPGACAAIAALSVAGLPSDRFVFEGFLSAKAGARRSRLQELVGETRTVIYYESSHRVLECLEDMREIFGAEREVVLARELTKMFETVLGEPLGTLVERVAADPNQQKGEFVLMAAGHTMDEDARVGEGLRVFAILREDMPPAKAAKLAAAITGAPRKALYGAG
ncbi:16S rRNA (cytidine1402-2'-O)-methyltransferase [Luteibacter rhizovicinus]|uniref:Ribosomal RNA small subunit methyltransferase I n=1 Tax=Luteibacter rhizovicinus TaxID=242606 RepID=A0A4R3YQD4_9GAMM|nr:16S rRNA (cytidine(1402)-2'-O)-methyltransferase [Luteibacter rhizovicinus]TCV93828.1 16S rRNA (cytidine1402-2'-O)-methyltransferase [Luteibacter rhizovicinus]